MEYETSEFVYELVGHDGSDLVIGITDLEIGEVEIQRIDAETASHYRPFTDVTFADFCDAILDDNIAPYDTIW